MDKEQQAVMDQEDVFSRPSWLIVIVLDTKRITKCLDVKDW